ncbi:unnamed protein product [Leptidea sinapis]|uniref:Uncharacterized protein n=1 Tax=Leptidea sinapis TaxID=189913 RepID=A0A5E4Q097_9NEOP|nr:unnamed protein product [Leptidea sinapis]
MWFEEPESRDLSRRSRRNTEVANAFEFFFTDIPLSTTKELNSSSTSAVAIMKKSVPECATN